MSIACSSGLGHVATLRRQSAPSPQNGCLLSRRWAGRQRRESAPIVLPTKASMIESIQGAVSLAALPSPGLVVGAAVNSTVYLVGLKVLLAGLTPAAVAHSWALGTAIYAAFGPGGYLLVCMYFILGSAVTKVKLEQKQKEGIAEARSGRRSIWSVWGSGAAGIVCAGAALASGGVNPYQVGFVASFASKLSDTVSSEIGKAYGRTTYLVTSMERVPRGTEGAVSLEGTAAGVLAALLFAGLALAVKQVDLRASVHVVIAATLANFFESYLGATLQGQKQWLWLTNDVVNMIQISVAAAIAIILQTNFS